MTRSAFASFFQKDNANADQLRVRESGEGRVFVENLSEHIVKNKESILQHLQAGKAQRTTNSTKMNRVRCHFLFRTPE
jgi:hypothetical protein